VKLIGRIFASVLGLGVLWLAVTMAVSPDLIVPIPEHGGTPQRVDYEPTFATEAPRYIAAALLGFFGLTLAVAPWRRRG
jgi:hypothetical protein